MANALPRPPHQWHFDAIPVIGPNGLTGINITHGERKLYLDLPKELEDKVEKWIEGDKVRFVDNPPIIIEKPLPVPKKRTLGAKLKALISA